jgi:hypothetical protein
MPPPMPNSPDANPDAKPASPNATTRSINPSNLSLAPLLRVQADASRSRTQRPSHYLHCCRPESVAYAYQENEYGSDSRAAEDNGVATQATAGSERQGTPKENDADGDRLVWTAHDRWPSSAPLLGSFPPSQISAGVQPAPMAGERIAVAPILLGTSRHWNVSKTCQTSKTSRGGCRVTLFNADYRMKGRALRRGKSRFSLVTQELM